MTRILPVKAWIKWTEAGGQYEGKVLADSASGPYFWLHCETELKRIARREEKPDALGYAKTEVRIEFADGANYDARLDLKHPANTAGDDPDCDLSRHIVQFAECYAGRACPPHMTEDRYRDFVARTGAAEAYGRWLDNYALTGEQIREAQG